MCGISGIIQTNSAEYSLQHLQKMSDALAHRGPDGEGQWANTAANVLLAHRRLSIIDLSDAGKQPMHYLNRYVIVHNGEIYNYQEIKETLLQKGYTFQSQTDTEVIAAAYDFWQEACVLQFDGMFAFAIWDEKENELFAARDRFGEKPFFYFYDENRFLFASEMKALWAAGIPKIPNQKMLFNYITIGYTGNPERLEETFYENIYKLPAASYLKFSLVYFTYTVKKYWCIDFHKENKSISDNEAIAQFSNLISDSVQKRLRSDVAVGTSLSGGLDSSSILALIKECGGTNASLNSFTASFSGFEKNEKEYASIVAKKFSVNHNIVEVSANDIIKNWEKLCFHQEEPFGSSSIYAQYKVFESAKQHGTKVLLDGQGADETLAGYSKYYKWYWQELFRKGKLSGRKELNAARALGVTEPFTWKNKIASWFPSFATIVLEKQYLAMALSHPGLTKDFVQQQSQEAYYTPPDYFNLNGVLYFNTFTYGLEELLRFADRNSMANSIEVRLPFLSHQLVEFLFTLPASFKIRQGWTKWLLRETMKNKLPEQIVWRKDKVGFEPPQLQWMQTKPIQELIIAAKEKLVEQNILNVEVLSQKITAKAAHENENFDWRYLTASLLFK